MKKIFVGNVNGVEYTNRKDFNEAVKRAIKENSENLCITSYEKNVDDCEIESKEEPKKIENNFLQEDEFVIDVDSDKLFNHGFQYNVSDELVEKLKNCSNKNEVRESIEKHIDEWKSVRTSVDFLINKYEKEINEVNETCNNTIRELNSKIDYQQQYQEEIRAILNYYNGLLGYLNCKKSTGVEREEKEVCEKPCNCKKEETYDFLKELQSLFENDFPEYLRKKGFF